MKTRHLREHVEGLLQEGVFEEEARRVAVHGPAVWVPGLVECVPEHLPTQGHPPAHQQPR